MHIKCWHLLLLLLCPYSCRSLHLHMHESHYSTRLVNKNNHNSMFNHRIQQQQNSTACSGNNNSMFTIEFNSNRIRLIQLINHRIQQQQNSMSTTLPTTATVNCCQGLPTEHRSTNHTTYHNNIVIKQQFNHTRSTNRAY